MPDPIFRLPPYEVSSIVPKLDQTQDWSLAASNIPEHWKKTKGKGVVVGIVDTGIDSSHPDLQGAILAAQDFSGSFARERDRAGHGTHCAGVIGARNNDLGVVGVAPECSLVIAKSLGDDGSGSGKMVAAGIDFCVAKGADIISMSLGSPFDDPYIRAAYNRAVTAGKIVICAAGNDGSDDSVNYPGKYAIAVAAYDKQFRIAKFSSRGPEVTCAAPGVDILSTVPREMGNYAKMSGTSMATPHVAAVMALLLAYHRSNPSAGTPVSNQDEAREHLHRSAKDAGSPGFDPAFGWGLISPDSLLSQPSPPIVPAPPGQLVIGPFPIPSIGYQASLVLEPISA